MTGMVCAAWYYLIGVMLRTPPAAPPIVDGTGRIIQ